MAHTSLRGRVAIVGEDGEEGAALAALLASRGFEVTRYRADESARRALSLAPPDLIVCDEDITELPAVPRLPMGKATPPAVLVSSIERVFVASDSTHDGQATLEAVAAGAAHQINDPLACIFVNLEELRDALPDDVGHAMRELVEDSLEAAHRIRRTVRDLQSYLRGDDGRPMRVEIEQVLDVCLRLVRTHLGHRAVIAKAYAPAPMVVSVDGRLRQLFVQLLLHVAESIPPHGGERPVVTVKTRTGARGDCEVEVVRSGLSEDPRGGGFGVSLCEAIARSAGGRLEIAGNSLGMSWRVTLPAAHPLTLSQRHAPVASAASSGARRRVLIVDDDELLARALARGLAPHDVTVAISMREAFELLLVDAGYDLVLCDARMPRGAGIELYSQLRALRPGAEKTIVFMTAAAEDSAELELVRELPNRILFKPFEVRELRRLLEGKLS